MAVLKREEVIDDWGVLIENANGNAEQVFGSAVESLEATEVPNVRMERREMAPGFVRGMFGAKREFVVISERGNRRLRPYQMYINARDYGTNLAVDWHLTYRPGFWSKLVGLMMFIPGLNLLVLPFVLLGSMAQRGQERRGSLDLDLFDQQDLRTYVTNAHRCLLKAVDGVMATLGQDASQIERRSRGFLGIS